MTESMEASEGKSLPIKINGGCGTTLEGKAHRTGGGEEGRKRKRAARSRGAEQRSGKAVWKLDDLLVFNRSGAMNGDPKYEPDEISGSTAAGDGEGAGRQGQQTTSQASASSVPAACCASVSAASNTSVWEQTFNEVNREISKTTKDVHLIEAYSAGWKGRSKERVVPKQELERAGARVKAMKNKVRELLQGVAALHADHVRVVAAIAGDGDEMDIEDLPCSKCGDINTQEDNDIILCDHPGCDRAYHEKCLSPPLSQEEKDRLNPEEPFICRQCGCISACLELINERLGEDFRSVNEVFAELVGGSGEAEGWSSAEESDDSDYEQEGVEDEEDDEEDEEGGTGADDDDDDDEDDSDDDSDDDDDDEEDDEVDEEGVKEKEKQVDSWKRAEVVGEDKEEAAAKAEVGEGDLGSDGDSDDEDDDSSDDDDSDDDSSDSSSVEMRSLTSEEARDVYNDWLAGGDDVLVMEQESGPSSGSSRRPRRGAAEACSKVIDGVLSARARAGKGVHREEDVPAPRPLEKVKECDSVARSYNGRFMAGMVLAAEEGCEEESWWVTYEGESSPTLLLKRPDVEEGRLLYEIYQDYCANGGDIDRLLRRHIQTRWRELGYKSTGAETEEKAGKEKTIVSNDVLSTKNIIEGKRTRRGSHQAQSSVAETLGVLGDRAPVTFGLSGEGGAQDDDDDDDDEDYDGN